MTVKNSDPEANIPKGKENSFLEWTRTILPILISWPTFALLFLFTFKSSLMGVIDRFSAAEGSKAEFGPVKVEIGRTVLPPQYQNGLPTVTTTVKVDYSDRVSQIKDEGTTGSTVGYSTSYALEIILHDSDFKGREVSALGGH